MEMTLAVQYRFTLAPDEFRLVSKGLRGTTMTDEERAQARALQQRMMQVRAQQAEQMLDQFDKAADAADAEGTR